MKENWSNIPCIAFSSLCKYYLYKYSKKGSKQYLFFFPPWVCAPRTIIFLCRKRHTTVTLPFVQTVLVLSLSICQELGYSLLPSFCKWLDFSYSLLLEEPKEHCWYSGGMVADCGVCSPRISWTVDPGITRIYLAPWVEQSSTLKPVSRTPFLLKTPF